jgi:hypothetical protein
LQVLRRINYLPQGGQAQRPYWIDVRVVESASWDGIPEIENWHNRNMLYAAQLYSEANGGLAEVNLVDIPTPYPTPQV